MDSGSLSIDLSLVNAERWGGETRLAGSMNATDEYTFYYLLVLTLDLFIFAFLVPIDLNDEGLKNAHNARFLHNFSPRLLLVINFPLAEIKTLKPEKAH